MTEQEVGRFYPLDQPPTKAGLYYLISGDQDRVESYYYSPYLQRFVPANASLDLIPQVVGEAMWCHAVPAPYAMSENALARDRQEEIERLLDRIKELEEDNLARILEIELLRDLRVAGMGPGLIDSPDEPFLKVVRDELARARAKFPSNAHMLAALMEEVGELARALLETEGPSRVREEAAQVACVAVRIATEGDVDFAPQEPGAKQPCVLVMPELSSAEVGRLVEVFQSFDFSSLCSGQDGYPEPQLVVDNRGQKGASNVDD